MKKGIAWLSLLMASSASGQLAGGGDFDLERAAMVGGGQASSGSMTMNAVVGQFETGTSSNGPFQLEGGFLAADRSDVIFATNFE